MTTNGKPDGGLYVATDAGIAFLLPWPKQVLEDLARAIECRHGRVVETLAVAREMQSELAAMQDILSQVLPNLGKPAAADSSSICDGIIGLGHGRRPPAACPLPDLFQRLQTAHPALTIGRFHDGLRGARPRAGVPAPVDRPALRPAGTGGRVVGQARNRLFTPAYELMPRLAGMPQPTECSFSDASEKRSGT